MILDGYIKDKNNQPVALAEVELKDNNFETLYSTYTDTKGYYKFDIPSGHYPFFLAVKGYKETGLEYWCQDIILNADLKLDAKIDTLEVYGLHAFSVKGAGNGLMPGGYSPVPPGLRKNRAGFQTGNRRRRCDHRPWTSGDPYARKFRKTDCRNIYKTLSEGGVI